MEIFSKTLGGLGYKGRQLAAFIDQRTPLYKMFIKYDCFCLKVSQKDIIYKERRNASYFVFVKYLINCLPVSFDASFSISQFKPKPKALEIVVSSCEKINEWFHFLVPVLSFNSSFDLPSLPWWIPIIECKNLIGDMLVQYRHGSITKDISHRINMKVLEFLIPVNIL